jgi:hypothetical protein
LKNMNRNASISSGLTCFAWTIILLLGIFVSVTKCPTEMT